MDQGVRFIWEQTGGNFPRWLRKLEGHSATQLGQYGRMVYLYGGRTPGRIEPWLEISLLDTETGECKRLARVKTEYARTNHTAFISGDSMYIFAGEYSASKAATELLRFDLVTGEVEVCETIGDEPPALLGISGDYIEDIDALVAFGGRLKRGPCFDTLYHLSHKKVWRLVTAKGKTPASRFGHTTCCIPRSRAKSEIFLFGGARVGAQQTEPVNDLHVLTYIGHSATWSQPKVTGGSPAARFQATLCRFGSRLILYGGRNGTEKAPGMDLFDTAVHMWFKLGVALSKFKVEGQVRPKTGHAAVTLDNTMLVLGGSERVAHARAWILKPNPEKKKG